MRDNHIHLIDNDSAGTIIPQDCISDILQIAGIGRLQNASDLLVFPHFFSDLKDGVGDLSILTLKDAQFTNGQCVSVKVCTGNLMGFVGINNTSISIHSRFTHKKANGAVDESSPDYFLYYMLQKVLSINVFKLEHSSSREDKILDFLLLLFPMMLKKAMAQGLYKEYQRFQHDDDRVRGTIDVNRYIKADIPFRGSISYSTREHSYDNTITQLIRHTIEYIKHHPFGHALLSNDSETLENVRQIVSATRTYNLRDRKRVLNANRRPKVHPYFTNYRELQQLCVQILRFDSLKYGDEKDRIYGVLFDGAWLWEEYLNFTFHDAGFVHPENKTGIGKIFAFKGRSDYYRFPDFLKDNIIADAKYKVLLRKNKGMIEDNLSREDLHQMISYMHITASRKGIFVSPLSFRVLNSDTGEYYPETAYSTRVGELYGDGGNIYIIGMNIPQSCESFKAFSECMTINEKELYRQLKKICIGEDLNPRMTRA